VIANNRAWKSAEAVRRDWLTTFLARKTAPKGSAAYLATALACDAYSVSRAAEQCHDLALTLLGMDPAQGRTGIATTLESATDGRAQVISLALVLAAYERGTGVHTWRNVTEAGRRYFAFLVANGYTLCEVEQIAAGTSGTE
jgi:ParB family chromosome partitioning protein